MQEVKKCKKKCKHTHCNVEFSASRKDRLFCSRDCKNKYKNLKRYYNDDDYKNKQNNSAMCSYQNKKKAHYVRLGELTEEQIEHLKTIRPEWFK